MWIIIVIGFILNLVLADGKKFTLEAEKYAVQRQKIMQRSNAFSKQSVWMHKREKIGLDFCLEKQSTVQVIDIRYSNDGPLDQINISLDDHVIGTLTSEASSREGHDWNVFHAAGKIGRPTSLSAGRHVVTLDVSLSDYFGLELDAVILDINDPQLEEETFKCTLYCFDDVDYSDAARRDDVASATFIQQSYRTLCTEESNVRVDIYHEEANKFRITAMPPKYKTFSNSRNPDFSNCKSTDALWEFKNFALREIRGELQAPAAVASFSGTANRKHILITFWVSDQNAYEGSGNILHMKLKNLRSPINMSLACMGKSRKWLISDTKIFTDDHKEMTWILPNTSWTGAGSNHMQITLYSTEFYDAVVEEIRLSSNETEQSTNEVPFVIFQNNDFIIKGENINPWWLGNTSMSVRRTDNGQSFKNVECLSVYLKEPWSDRFSKVFRLCQDGYMHLLPVTPHGLDWIPFGSKIIVGQSNPTDIKPYAALTDIDVDPERLKLKLTFYDKTSLTLQIEPSRFETSVKIIEYIYAKDRKKFPALSFQSMWVANGRADVDHMTINGDEARPIMTEIGPLHGISAVFFRKCISSHNTLSPDIKIEVLGNGE